jgi:hypothetical protein
MKRSTTRSLSRVGMMALAVGGAASAAPNTDPYVYDPAFNSGVVIEDRFAATSTDNRQIAQKLVVLPNSDVIVAGLVPAAFQANQSSGYNLGLVRYGQDGSRVPWGGPTPAYSYYFDHYLDYPNGNTAAYRAISGIIYADDHVYVLVDYAYSATDYDVYIVAFDVDGAWVGTTAAFSTSLMEHGAGLVASPGSLIAVATYQDGTGRGIVTLKRFARDPAGSLTVDTTFGHVNNGAIDHAMPNDRCDAPPCSVHARALTALRTDTTAPTLYIVGDAPNAGSDWNPFVMAVDGAAGDLSTSFGGGTGIYVQYGDISGSSKLDSGRAIAASTSGGEASDIIYLAAEYAQQCGEVTAITKLRASVALPGGPYTLPDYAWGAGGTALFGGDNSLVCGAGTHVTVPNAMVLSGSRLAIVGQDDIIGTITPLRGPMLAMVRVSDGALIEFHDYLALRGDGSVWGKSSLDDVVAAAGNRFTAAGTIDDAQSAGGQLFGTARFASDRIFAGDFE